MLIKVVKHYTKIAYRSIRSKEKLHRERIVTLILCFWSDLETSQINTIMHVWLSRTRCRQVTSLFSLAIIVLSQSDGKLIITPRNTESKVGETTYFNCSTDLKSSEIFWHHGNKDIYTGNGILEPYRGRFEIDRNASIGSHNLVIHSVEPGDAGEYICADDEGYRERISAQLIVLESNPDCLSNIKPDGVIGQNVFNIPRDEVELTCNVTYYGNITPQMEWKKFGDMNNSIKDGVMSHVISDNRLIHTVKFRGDLALDNSSYICQTTRSTQNQYTCTSEIIKVLYFVGGNMIEQKVFKGDEITCAAKRNTFSCINQWHYDNYTLNETITTQLLGEYLCTVKCRIRGTAHTYDAMKAFVAELKTSDSVPYPEKSASPMAPGTIAAAAVVPIIIIVILAASTAVLAVRKKRKGDKQRMNDDLDEIALLGFPDSDIANESHVISRNHQFLVENIKPGRLIDLLRENKCITDEEWNQFMNKSTDEFINESLLQWMRTIDFDEDNGQMVLKCIRQDKQDFVADLLEKGGVVIKSLISAKLVKTNKFTKSSLKNVDKLKEKEAIVIERVNKTQGLPLSEDRDATLQIPLDDIVIAPYCRQETNEIVFWFLCKSADGKRRLQRMNKNGSLREKLIKVFKQCSNDSTSVSSTLLVPTKITIDFEEEIVKEEVELLGKINVTTRDAKFIVGVAILNEALFIAHIKSSELEVYKCNDFHNVRLLDVEGLVAPFDMCSCVKNNCLYISDAKSDGKDREVLRVGTDENVVGRWLTHDNERGNLSATPEGNVIMTVWDKQMLLEYSPTGKMERIINLPDCAHPWHAIKRDDRFIVSHGGFSSGFNRICLVDKQGKVEKSLMHQTVDQVHRACHLAAHGSSGVVIVADRRNNRVLLFDSKLEFKAKIVLKNKLRFKQPRIVSLSETSLAVQIDGGVSYDTIQNNDVEKNCTILVFDIKPLLEKYRPKD